jgi:hypothetical protein
MSTEKWLMRCGSISTVMKTSSSFIKISNRIAPLGACNELTIKRKEFKMEDLICTNCGIRTVNGTLTYCDECEHELQELYDAEQVELLEEVNGLAEGEE